MLKYFRRFARTPQQMLHTMPSAIPDRWLNYKPIGKQIEGTRFIAFKVPLRERVNEKVDKELRLDASILLKTVPNLGMIIDLTNTQRYYNPHTFVEKGLEYSKLNIPGHQTPEPHLVTRFKELVKTFLNKSPDKLIGIHCTHGVNRTGYLICHYMISELDMKPEVAIDKFAVARGHKIERKNYLDSLNRITSGTNRDSSASAKNPYEHKLIMNNQTLNKAHRTDPTSFAPPEPTLAPSPQVFDRRDRFERFRQEANEKRSLFMNAKSQTSQPQPINSSGRLRSNSTKYGSRYVSTGRRDSQGGANQTHQNNHRNDSSANRRHAYESQDNIHKSRSEVRYNGERRRRPI